MDKLDIALLVLVIAGIWALVELALTFKASRKTLNEVSRNVNNTIEEIQPIIEKVDGVVDEIQPASKQLDPLLMKANTAVDALTVDLATIDNILSDVSTVTGTASGVTNSVATGVTKAIESTANAAAGVFNKYTHKEDKKELKAKEQQCLEGEKQEKNPVGKRDYITYPTTSSDSDSE